MNRKNVLFAAILGALFPLLAWGTTKMLHVDIENSLFNGGTVSNNNITAGTMNGTVIDNSTVGQTTPLAGTFTTLIGTTLNAGVTGLGATTSATLKDSALAGGGTQCTNVDNTGLFGALTCPISATSGSYVGRTVGSCTGPGSSCTGEYSIAIDGTITNRVTVVDVPNDNTYHAVTFPHVMTSLNYFPVCSAYRSGGNPGPVGVEVDSTSDFFVLSNTGGGGTLHTLYCIIQGH